MIKTCAVAVVAAMWIASPAVAQDYVPMYTPDFQGSMALNTMVGNQLQRDSRRSSGTTTSSPRASLSPSTRSGSAVTTYRGSSAVTARVKTQFADFLQGEIGADGAARVRQVMDRGDPVASWAGIVRSDGLRPGDLADSMAAYWVLNWVMANQGDNNRAQTQAVRDQVRGIIATNPELARMTDAQRQEMSEALMLNFLVQHAAYGDAAQRGDRAMMGRLGDAAVRRFRSEMGVDLRRLTLTDSGFAPA